MAILAALPGIQVTVSIGGITLKEYNNENPEVGEGEIGRYQASKTISKYIESHTDQEFAIHLSVKRPYEMDCEGLAFRVYVDGRLVRSPLLRKAGYEKSRGKCVTCVEGIQGNDVHGNPVIHHFKFAILKTTIDDDKKFDVKGDAQALKEIGELKVSVYRKSAATKSKAPVSQALEHDYIAPVHEESMKGQAKSHVTALGHVSRAILRGKLSSKLLDGVDFPIAIYKFKYRSCEALKSLLVISRTPTPEPSRARSAAPTPGPGPLSLRDPVVTTGAMPAPQGPRNPFNMDNLTAAKREQVEKFLSELIVLDESADLSKASTPPSDVVLPTGNIKSENQAGVDGLPHHPRVHSTAISTVNQENQLHQVGPRALSALVIRPKKNIKDHIGPMGTGETFGALNTSAAHKRKREESDPLDSRKQAKTSQLKIGDLALDD